MAEAGLTEPVYEHRGTHTRCSQSSWRMNL